MSRIIFIADFFSNEISGGGELNNDEFIEICRSRGITVDLAKSFHTNLEFLRSNKEAKFVVANFVGLPEESKAYLQDHCQYVIYEHDHKYLSTRDPSPFECYKAPDSAIINKSFYEAAKGIFCQSNLHKEIMHKNLLLDNIYSLGGNLWSLENLEKLWEYSKKEKKDKYSIWNSTNPIKCTSLAEAYCYRNNLESELIGPLPNQEFLSRLSDNKYFVFFPQTVETLGRVVVEAKMAGMTVISNKRVGALSEDWFKLKGEELVAKMTEKRMSIPDSVLGVLL